MIAKLLNIMFIIINVTPKYNRQSNDRRFGINCANAAAGGGWWYAGCSYIFPTARVGKAGDSHCTCCMFWKETFPGNRRQAVTSLTFYIKLKTKIYHSILQCQFHEIYLVLSTFQS